MIKYLYITSIHVTAPWLWSQKRPKHVSDWQNTSKHNLPVCICRLTILITNIRSVQGSGKLKAQNSACVGVTWIFQNTIQVCYPQFFVVVQWQPVQIHTYFLTYLLTYLLTPWCRVLLEKLTGLQLVKKFPAFHGTRRFITALTSVRHLSLSWTSPIQSIYPHPTSWRSILMLSTHLRLGLPSGLLPSGFPTKTLYTPSPHPYAPHAQPISFFSILSPAQYWVRSTNHLAPRYAVSSIPPLPRPS